MNNNYEYNDTLSNYKQNIERISEIIQDSDENVETAMLYWSVLVEMYAKCIRCEVYEGNTKEMPENTHTELKTIYVWKDSDTKDSAFDLTSDITVEIGSRQLKKLINDSYSKGRENGSASRIFN